MSVAEVYKEQLSRAEFSDLLPPLTFDSSSKLWFTSDNCIAMGWVSNPMVGAPEGASDKISTLLSQPFPTNSILSVALWASPDITPYVESMIALREDARFADQPVLERAIRDKARFFLDGASKKMNDGMYTSLRDFISVITVKIPVSRPGLPSDSEWRIAAELRTSVEKGLETIGLMPTVLTADIYLRILSTMLNWGDNSSWKSRDTRYDVLRPVNEQMLDLDTSLEVKSTGLLLGQKRIKVLSPKRYPDWVMLPMMQMLIGEPRYGRDGIPGNFLCTMNIQFTDPLTERESRERKRTVVNYQANGPFGAMSQKLRTRKEDYDILFTSVEAGDKILRMQHTFVLFSDTDEQATQATAQMMAFYRDMQMQVQEDAYVCVPLFIGALPMCADPDPGTVKFLKRYRTSTTGLASELLPIIGDWKGTAKPVLSYITRNGQPMGVDIYETSSNMNWLCCAQSGSGKSFWANDMIVSYMSTGARVYVIDVGRSYKKICEALKGEFLVFSNESDLCLNAFEMVTDFEEESGMLVDMIKTMSSPSTKVDDWGTARISKVVSELWSRHGPSTTIDHVAEALISDTDRRASDLGQQLFNFTSKGTFGRWFIGKNNVSFTKQLTVLELEELNSKPNLQTVILLQLLYQITQSMYVKKAGDDGQMRRTIIVIDEAWALLGKGDVAAFMITAYRRCRKVNGAIGLITQSVSDLYQNEAVGLPILENSQWFFLLQQKRESIEILKRSGRLSLSDGGFELLKTVHTSKGRYSEVFIYTSVNGQPAAGIGRLIVTRFAQLLYTTDPSELNMLLERQSRGMSLEDAIEDVIQMEKSL